VDTPSHTELATKAATDDLKNVDSKVGVVRTDLIHARRPENGPQRDWHAHRAEHDEIDQLAASANRDYIEFTIAARTKPEKVGNVTSNSRPSTKRRVSTASI